MTFSACGSRAEIYCSLRHNTVLTVSLPDIVHSRLVIPYSLNQYRTIISSWVTLFLESSRPLIDYLLSRFGYTTAISQLLTVPPYVFASTYQVGVNLYDWCWRLIASNCSLDIRALVGQIETSVAIYSGRVVYAHHWIRHQHLQRTSWCEILWDILVRCWKLCAVPWYCSMVGIYVCL